MSRRDTYTPDDVESDIKRGELQEKWSNNGRAEREWSNDRR